MKKLTGKKVAILAADGFEQVELEKPLEALKKEGAEVEIVSLKKGRIRAWKNKDWGDEFESDVAVSEAEGNDYDSLVLPGGVINPDTLRSDKDAVEFVKSFLQEKKPVAAICHGPWTLIETGLLKGRKMTSYKSIKTDLINAGSDWTDQEVVVDSGLVTSREPKDLPAFCEKMVEEFAEGVHQA